MPEERRSLLVSRGWLQAVVLVVLFGFFVLGLLAYRTYQAKPPIPDRVVDPSGRTALHRAATSERGQKVFLHNGLMEYGSVFGHGAYLGPGLHRGLPAPRVGPRQARLRRRRARTARPADDRGLPHQPLRRAHGTLSSPRRRPTPTAGSSRTTAASSPSRRPSTACARTRSRIATSSRQLTAFFALDGLGGVAERPGHNYSYTNNWPPEPRVDNRPTANVIVWSVLSLIALLGGIGLLFGAFGRWGRCLGWHGREQATLRFRAPGDVALTPAQRALRLVLLRHGGAVPDPDARRRRLPALPRRDRQLLRHRPGQGRSRTT